MQVIDGEEAPDAGAEGAADGAQDAEASAAAATESKPADAAAGAGGETAGEAGEDAGETEAGSGEEEPGSESEPLEEEQPDPVERLAASLEERFAKLEEALQGRRAEKAAPTLSDEDWANLEQTTGVGRKGHEHFAGLINHGLQRLEQKLMSALGDKVNPVATDRAIDVVAGIKGFADARVLKPAINKFLAKFDAAQRSSPDLIKDAVIWARGMKASESVARAAKGAERNKTIAGAARPASPGGKGTGKAPVTLNAAQKSAAMRLPGGEAEYRKLLDRKGTGPMTFE
jgi:hypothetical protein